MKIMTLKKKIHLNKHNLFRTVKNMIIKQESLKTGRFLRQPINKIFNDRE